jgi:hypothetical protein
VIYLLLGCPSPEPVVEACDVCEGDCVEEYAAATGRSHVEGTVDYPSYPPSSGDHSACWAEWGVHEDTVATENWVHNLEHGGVVFVYEAGLPELASLTTAAAALPEGRYVVTAASAPMDGVVAAVSWEHRLVLGCYDESALLDFFWANIGNAPEDVTSPPNPDCTME